LAIEALIARYGLVAVFAGAGIEGEVAVITGGILAQSGVLSVWGVMIAASAGACLVDQLWFWMARHFAHTKWVERAKRKPAFRRALSILEHHLILFTLGFRFIYGMRTVTPIAISASKIRTHTFVLLNIVSAAIWGPIMTGIGYGFGQVLGPWLKGPSATLFGLGGLALVIGAVLLFTWIKRRRAAAHPEHSPA
jgi:membrane protein DedA with SNARE-associated domain